MQQGFSDVLRACRAVEVHHRRPHGHRKGRAWRGHVDHARRVPDRGAARNHARIRPETCPGAEPSRRGPASNAPSGPADAPWLSKQAVQERRAP